MTTRTLRVIWNLLVIGAMAFYLTRFGKYPLQSTLFPRLIGYPVLGLSILGLALEVLRARRTEPAGDGPVVLGDLALGVGLGVLYGLLWGFLGFVVDTIVFLLVAPVALGYALRRTLWLLGVGVATAALFTFLFHLGSGAILPRGILPVGWL